MRGRLKGARPGVVTDDADLWGGVDRGDEILLTGRADRTLDWRFGAVLIACYLVLVSVGLLFMT